MKELIYKHSSKVIYIILFVFGIIFFTTVITNHYLFRTVAWDYGTYNFAFWDYSHFRISDDPVFMGTKMTFLQDHFSFTLMFFIPVYWLLNWLTGTYTLLIIQTSIIIISGWFLYKLIYLKTANIYLGFLSVIYFYVLQGSFICFDTTVNIAIIYSCFIPIFLYFFEKKKYVLSTIMLLLSLLSRENVPLIFIFICIVLIIWHRKERKVIFISLIYLFISLFYFILVFKVFIPFIETPDKHYSLFNYSSLGANPADAFSFIIHKPIDALNILFSNHSGSAESTGVKDEFFLVYLISGGFVLFLRPQYFIWFIPIIAQKLFNDDYIRWGIYSYYSIEVVALLPISVFLIVSEEKTKFFKYQLAVLICLLSVLVTIYKCNPANAKVDWTRNMKENIFNKSFFKTTINIKKTNEYLNSIPCNAKISASTIILPHLAQRQSIYYFPEVKDAEYIVLFDHDCHPLSPDQYEIEIQKYLNNKDWSLMVKDDPLIILHRNSYQSP